MSAALVLRFVWAASPARALPALPPPDPIQSLAFYRKRTEALLRRYMQTSMEVGRSPSILGNCVFRGKVSSSRLRTFEDSIIFVFDIEKCLKTLDRFGRDLIARIALQEYSHVETAALTGQSLRSVFRKYHDSIDQLTALFLEYELLSR